MKPADNELRASTLIGYWFIAGSLIMLTGFIHLAIKEAASSSIFFYLLIPVLLFTLFLGIRAVIKPGLLVKVTDENVELYSAFAFKNPCEVIVPLDDILSIKVTNVHDHRHAESSIMMLSLTLRYKSEVQVQEKSKSAEKYSKTLRKFPPNTLHWSIESGQRRTQKTESKLALMIGKKLTKLPDWEI